MDYYGFEILERDGIEYLNLCDSSFISEGKGRQFLFGDDIEKQVAVFRVKGILYCLTNICPHRHQDQIHNGFIDDLNVICPVHGWTYSLETGDNKNLKQGIKKLDSFKIFEESNRVFIELPQFKLPLWRETSNI